MRYDPFARGPFPVGVRTIELHDPVNEGRALTELWYPAPDRYRGQDLAEGSHDTFPIAPGLPEGRQQAVRGAAPLAGPHPLFLYFHGGYGHRREMTHIATHLASHGYVVAAPDFPGDNIRDTFASADASAAPMAKKPIDESARARPGQASAFLEQILAEGPAHGLALDAARIGSGGMSMGGFTSLALHSIDPRPRASFVMCPLCGTRSPLPQVRRLQSLLRVDDWRRPASSFLLTGAADPFVIADDVRDLYGRLPSPKRLALLDRAGHVHFADGAATVHESMRLAYLSGAFPDPEIDAPALGRAMRPFSELTGEAKAADTARSLCLAHMDACLRDCAEARAFLDADLAGTFAARGIGLEVPPPSSG